MIARRSSSLINVDEFFKFAVHLLKMEGVGIEKKQFYLNLHFKRTHKHPPPFPNNEFEIIAKNLKIKLLTSFNWCV